MNPAFSAGQLRSFLPLFQGAAQEVSVCTVTLDKLRLMERATQLSDKWNSLLQMRPKGGQRLDVHQWISRCSLNIIGKSELCHRPRTLNRGRLTNSPYRSCF